MPHSDCTNKPYFVHLLVKRLPKRILDVGCGYGTYGRLARAILHDDVSLTGVEVWQPYIEAYRLRDVYDDVLERDARTLTTFDYDMIIFGDVLEHMTVGEAQTLWRHSCQQSPCVWISIPIVPYEQGAVNGNPFEQHIIPDYSIASVLERFPGITQFRAFPITGAFVYET